MRIKEGGFRVLFLLGACCLAVCSGCASGKKDIVEDSARSGASGQETYKPSELSIPSRDSYEFSYMGLRFSLPDSLMERMDRQEIAMLNFEDITIDEMELRYALIGWKVMTEEQRDMEVERDGDGFNQWSDSLASVGAIGAYQEDRAGMLDELTGCTEHKEIGKSKDGSYTYYLSVSPDADSSLQEEINRISYEITDMVSVQEYLESSSRQQKGEEAGNTGDFSMQDITGETYTQEMFAEYDLTMVNVFTTWCTPCVNEIPDLQKLKDEMADQGVNVAGIVLDCIDSSGEADEKVVEKAKELARRTGVSYPFLIPDSSYLNGRLLGIDAVPETFFVDKEGNYVGETYSGSRSFEDWKMIVEAILKGAES